MVRGAFVSARVRFVRGLFAPWDDSPPRAIIEGNSGKEYQTACREEREKGSLKEVARGSHERGQEGD